MLRKHSKYRRLQNKSGSAKNHISGVESIASPPDSVLATATVFLVAIGIIFVYSAGASKSSVIYGSSSHFLFRQFFAAMIGVSAMIFFSKISLAKLDKFSGLFGLFTLFLLFIVLIPGIGSDIKGARRWINLGFGLRFQPSEFARLASVLLVARYASRFPENLRTSSGLCKCLFLPALFTVSILLEPDFDTAFTVLVIGCVILFTAGVPWRYILAGAAIMSAAAFVLILQEGYRIDRITGFLDPWADPRKKGYQIIQCWIAMGSGGIFGKGLGGSIQKLGFLPEAHTDFIFAIIGEEGGFMITSLIVLLFGVIVWKGYRIAMNQSIPFAKYVGVGITTMISMQALLNLMVVTGLAPTTGVPLPFVSYGGTSLIFTMSAMGILWGLSRRISISARIPQREYGRQLVKVSAKAV